MKPIFSFLFLVCLSITAQGQMMSYITALETSSSGVHIAEISLIHRSRTEENKNTDLGRQLIIVPGQPNGTPLKMEYQRFWTTIGSPFQRDGVTYVPVHFYYDQNTSDVRDDLYLQSVPFAVEETLVASEVVHYAGSHISSDDFIEAPYGNDPPMGLKD